LVFLGGVGKSINCPSILKKKEALSFSSKGGEGHQCGGKLAAEVGENQVAIKKGGRSSTRVLQCLAVGRRPSNNRIIKKPLVKDRGHSHEARLSTVTSQKRHTASSMISKSMRSINHRRERAETPHGRMIPSGLPAGFCKPEKGVSE